MKAGEETMEMIVALIKSNVAATQTGNQIGREELAREIRAVCRHAEEQDWSMPHLIGAIETVLKAAHD